MSGLCYLKGVSPGCRYVSFRVSHKPTQHVNIRRLCATSYEANSRQRAAMLCGLHPK